jgi:hypothetical protein
MSLSDHLFRGGVLGGPVVDHLASQGSLAYEREKGQRIPVNTISQTITVLLSMPTWHRARGLDPNATPDDDSTLTRVGSVTVPGAVGGKGIVAG